jgi:hypothetical protein
MGDTAAMATSIEPLAREDARGRISLLDPTREYDARVADAVGLLPAMGAGSGRTIHCHDPRDGGK